MAKDLDLANRQEYGKALFQVVNVSFHFFSYLSFPNDNVVRAGIDCGSLVSPINGQISVSSTTIGSTASYTCSSGYSLSGATVRTCQANGQWSGTAPVCVPVPTTSAPPPATTQQPTPSTGAESQSQ